MSTAAERWRRSLDDWALPEDVVAAAEESPWIHPPALFQVPLIIDSSPSHERAREVLREGDTVLDVGCGGGVAAFALTPPATHVIGVDQQAEMLSMFRANAHMRGVTATAIEGLWPDVADSAPTADVVTAHHVVYNVGTIVPFLLALSDHARIRVVLELPDHHPLTPMSEAWRHFWRLERPQGPTSTDLLQVLDEAGIEAHQEKWLAPARATPDPQMAAHFMRVRLCLPAEREGEVLQYLNDHPVQATRELSTVWWDVESTGARSLA